MTTRGPEPAPVQQPPRLLPPSPPHPAPACGHTWGSMAVPIRVANLPGHRSNNGDLYLQRISGGNRVMTRTRCETCGMQTHYRLRNSVTGTEDDIGGDDEVVQAALHSLLDDEDARCFALTFPKDKGPNRYVVPRSQLPVFLVGNY